ncbi:TPA: hypothetical protein PTV31_003106 [Clostridium botulinum]|nr:hypothetical protein [Clostridium botulinum]
MQNQFDITQLYLMIINGILVRLIATGTYDFKGRKKDDDIQTINNFYEKLIKDTNVATYTKKFNNIIKG